MKTETSETGIKGTSGLFRFSQVPINFCFFRNDLFSGGNNEGFKGHFEIGSRKMF